MSTIKVFCLLAMLLSVRGHFFDNFFGKSPFHGPGKFSSFPGGGLPDNGDRFDFFENDGDAYDYFFPSLFDPDEQNSDSTKSDEQNSGSTKSDEQNSGSTKSDEQNLDSTESDEPRGETNTTPKRRTNRKPTTKAPRTTRKPTTKAPATAPPTTAPPTTAPPTTAAPASAAPTTAAPAPLTNKDIIRPRLTKTEEQRARQAIRDFVDEHKEDDGTHPFNAALLRMSFHDCIGPRGCDGCINHNNIANENLKRVGDPLDALYDKDFEQTFTRADFYALAGIVSAQYAAELADCEGEGCVPNVPFKFGRLDCSRAEEQIHTFCPFNDDTEEFLIQQFNGTLTDEDITAIMGGHSVGRVNRDDGDAFDDTPDALDTDYYKQLVNHADWKQATGVRTSKDLDKTWMRSDGKLLMLGADISLLSDIGDGKDATCNPGPMKCPESKFRSLVKQFAEMDQKTFIDKFFKGLVKYQSKTVSGVILQDPIDG